MNIEAEVKQFIIHELVEEENLTDIDTNESLLARGFLDSVAMLQLISFLERTFGITVEESDKDLDNFETVRGLKAFIERKLQKSAS